MQVERCWYRRLPDCVIICFPFLSREKIPEDSHKRAAMGTAFRAVKLDARLIADWPIVPNAVRVLVTLCLFDSLNYFCAVCEMSRRRPFLSPLHFHRLSSHLSSFKFGVRGTFCPGSHRLTFHMRSPVI
ncbi:hypothetical protein L798_13202 [Zootermopsis nevadensis]|uniref:Uncharacterized protein n=1 Tax=Zootermopsis nevadensis TaxID=136037 RepID=A0A067R4S5_ZOONE|nr:hypothetical protein L798_13202 [Zootermopsis nevadensis]